MSEKVPRRVIYIGSIPYDQTEEQVLDIAKSIGPVLNMKMMFDKETGKSKGYAFVEYPDIETASSAVRNLNNYTIGNRALKCDFSSDDSLVGNSSASSKAKTEESLPPLPPGISLRDGENYADSISRTLRSLDPNRLQNIVRDTKEMAVRNSVLMGELLAQCPQLAYAIAEALLVTQQITPESISQILLNSATNTGSVPIAETSIAQEEELDDEKLALIKQVLQIPDEELAQLPEDQRSSILEIKQNARIGVYGPRILG